MKKKLFLFALLASLMFLQLVSADKNIITNNPPEGYVLDDPAFETVSMQNNVSFDFHVYNASSGNLINDSSLICQFHLYNQNGYHIFEGSPMWSANGDYFIVVTNQNFSYVGEYHYLASCDDGNIGGFIDATFYATPKGHDKVEGLSLFGSWILFFGVLFSLLFLFLYALGGMVSLKFDLLDVSYNIGAFFVLIGFKFYAYDYLGITLINDVLELAFQISIWTNVLIPIIGFFLTLLLGPYLLKRYPNIGGRMPGYKKPWEYNGGEIV